MKYKKILLAALAMVFLAIGLLFIPNTAAHATNYSELVHPRVAAGLSVPAPVNGVYKCTDTNAETCMSSNPIIQWLIFFINLFVLVVVIGSAVMIAWGGLEYITSAGVPEKTKAARDKIRNVVVGMLCLVFMWSFLQWLIPGGALNIDLPENTTPVANSTPAQNSGETTSNGIISPVTAGTNITTLDNVANFRDAGGSGFLKTGVLYRSGKLENADANQVAQLLGGGTIIDLRTQSVIKSAPDVKVSSVNTVNIPIHGTTDYTEFVTNADSRDGFKDAITAIANSDGKVLVHCTYGKDRTGWTIAMIMYALGATDAEVKNEYLKSSDVTAAMLNVGLSSAKAEYGSIDKYISDGLGISDSTIAKLRARLGS